jgi:hypothetical protein
MRAGATAFASAALALFSIVAAAHSHDAQAQVAAVSASGDVHVANSRNGSAILSGGLGPGDSLTGTVTISNIGSGAGDFVLGLSHLIDAPGPGGGFFSRQLDLAVDDVTVPSAPVAVYQGRLNSLNPTALGTFAPGAAHTYRFAVTWAPSAADPTMYGSSMSVEFDWSASDTVTTPVVPPPAPPPASPVTTTVAPPRLSVSIRRTQQVLKSGSLQASAACDEACTIVATGSVSVPGAARAYKLVPARGSLTAAGKAKLRLRLPKTARKPLRSALKARRKLFAPIVIQATGSSGKGAPVKRKVRITG